VQRGRLAPLSPGTGKGVTVAEQEKAQLSDQLADQLAERQSEEDDFEGHQLAEEQESEDDADFEGHQLADKPGQMADQITDQLAE
jgi:hypothetical protein